METNRSRGIIGILVFAGVLRLAWAIALPRTPEALAKLPDQQEYLSLGRNLLTRGELCFVDPRFQQTLWAYRMPGYPAVIAACGGSVLVVRIVQALADTSTVLAVYLLGRYFSRARPVEQTTGLFAAALLAVNPFYIYFSGLILSETLFTAALTWALVCLVHRRIALGMIFLIAACYFRPAAVFMTPVLAAVALLNRPSDPAYPLWRTVRHGLFVGVIAGLVTMLTLLPWAWRNHQRLGSWIWTTTNSGVTLYDGFNPAATGASDQSFLADLPGVRSMNEVDRSGFLSESAQRWARDHAGILPRLSLRKVLRSWSPVPLSADFGRPMYRFISAEYAVPFDLLCVVGLFAGRIPRRAKLLLITPAVLITVIEVMSVGSIRYRIPAEAPLAVLAAVGMVEARRRLFANENLR